MTIIEVRQSLKRIHSNQYATSVSLKCEKIGFNYVGHAFIDEEIRSKDL